MDINLLSRMVGELILDNERVNLPGIGTLVAVQMPASFSDRGYTINPPYRKLTVLADNDEDNLLVDLYASSNGIELEAARLIISNFLGELSQELEDARCVYFPELGKLRKTRDGSLFFVEDEDMNIDSVGFRLEPVSLKTHPVLPDFEPFAAEKEEPSSRTGFGISQEEQETLKQVQGDGAEVQGDGVCDRHINWFVKLLIWVFILAVVALGIIAVLGRVAPEIVDKILYSAEELRILYY